MSTVVEVPEVRIREVAVSEDAITVSLLDGRVVSVPLSWSWRLADASAEQRARYEIIGDGQGVRWPDIDEDLSAEGFLAGVPARRPVRPATAAG
jgi:regulator of protease activity HflC (stomatin/prohibitin superfamily)